MTQKLPKHLKGPFVNALYNHREGIIYLKHQNGEMTSTRTYPSFFIDKDKKNKFPSDEFSGELLDWIEEEDYWRITYDPSIKRERITELIYIAQDEGVKVYEADVSPVRRWFSDTGALVAQKYRSLFFDLETHPLQIGFDDEAKKLHRIISFAAYDEEGNSWFDSCPKSSDQHEAELIQRFLKLAKKYDVLLAWNGNNYDFYVLKQRCKFHNIRIDWRQWNLLDYMEVVKKLLSSISDPDIKRSFALDSVGENVLGIRKLKLQVHQGKLHTLLGKRVSELEEYNRRDVEIMLGIEKKREFLLLHYALCSLCRTLPNKGSTYPNSLADGMLLRLAVQEGKHFPSRIHHSINEDYQKYEGAYVMEPLEGFHTDIQVPDFASLYPSIILSWNMSNETMIRDNIDYPDNITSNLATATATGVMFRTDIEGIIPKALRTLIEKRNEYKIRSNSIDMVSDEYKNITRLSTAVKVVANSFYGLLGNEGSRYHDREIARSVTLTGQLLVRHIIQFFKDRNFQTVAADTDSAFVKASIPEMQDMLKEINDIFIPDILKKSGCRICTVSMGFDKGYSSLLIVTKKRYAGKLALHKGRLAPPDMKPEIKGLETRRSDQNRFSQTLQMKYIELLLDPYVSPVDIDNELRKDGEDFFTRKLEREEIEITKGLSKHPDQYSPKTPHVKVAEWMINEGMEFFVGMKIPFIVIDHKPNITAIHADKYVGKCDRVYYWEKQTLPPVLRMIQARFPGYSFDSFIEPRQCNFDFASQAHQTKKVRKSNKVTTMKAIKKPIKKITKPIKSVSSSKVITLTIPSSINNNVIHGISKLAHAFPGSYQLKIIVDINSLLMQTEITTEQYVSMECLKEIKTLFPEVIIDPKPI